MNPKLPFAALVGIALLASTLGRSPDAAAQRAQDDERDDVSMRMREIVSRPLGEAQSCVEMQDFECAVRALERVRAREDLYPYEEAIMWRFYAFVHFEQDDTAGAISAYENLLGIAELPSGLEQESSLTLAQLYAQQERFDDALAMLERWFSIVPDPGPDQYYLKARIYYQMQRYEDGIEPLERAIALADARGREPQEDWYNLLRVMYFETGDDENLLAVLHTLVEHWPGKEYVMHLAGTYGQRGDDDHQLALVEAAYELGWLERGSDLATYASMLLAAGVPHKAALVLEQALDAGTVESTQRNWRMLGQAWRVAQEDERALPALTRAAELADDGRIYAQLANAYANLARPEDCVDAAREALDRGVERPDQVNLVLGACLTDLRRYDDATAALEIAARDERSRELATDYMSYVDDEHELERRMHEAIAALEAHGEQVSTAAP